MKGNLHRAFHAKGDAPLIFAAAAHLKMVALFSAEHISGAELRLPGIMQTDGLRPACLANFERTEVKRRRVGGQFNTTDFDNWDFDPTPALAVRAGTIFRHIPRSRLFRADARQVDVCQGPSMIVLDPELRRLLA